MISIILILVSFVMMVVDTGLGMFYGTILSPVLIGAGFDPLVVIPAILLSQAAGDFVGIFSHHKFGNANFRGLTRDTKVTLTMMIPGALAVVVGALIAVSIPRIALYTYIGLLVLVLSLLCLRRKKYKFKWWRHIGYGTVASFNKVLTGGGFGPITSTGGIIGGLSSKVSIATTTFAEFLICGLSFVAYKLLIGVTDPFFTGCLCVGAVAGGLVGPYLCSRINLSKLRLVIATCGIISALWILAKAWLPS